MNATGVLIRNRNSGDEYAMHSDCADAIINLLIEDGYSVMDSDIPLVIIGPIFAEESEWRCAYSDCAH